MLPLESIQLGWNMPEILNYKLSKITIFSDNITHYLINLFNKGLQAITEKDFYKEFPNKVFINLVNSIYK